MYKTRLFNFFKQSLLFLLLASCLSTTVFANSIDKLEAPSASQLLLTNTQLSQVLAHGPWPPSYKADPSNRVINNNQAIDFGKLLFFSTELSKDKTISCHSCHAADTAFAGGDFFKTNPKALDRDTQSLLNVRFNRWFGWDGSNDNLWAQSMRPIINPKEMNLPLESLKTVIQSPAFKQQYIDLFGDIETHSDELILVNTGKALAVFQSTLVSEKTPFDRFRDAIANKDWKTASHYPKPAQRGLSIFLGRGNCSFCHSGATFSNGEFHDAGVPYFIRPGVVDAGRHQGIINLKKSAFNLASDYNDDPSKTGAWAVNNVATLHSNFGIFRVPSLREVASTAPYMHNGSLKTLEAVVDHYNNINTERLHADGEAILKPLELSEQESKDLVAFLKTLSADK